MSMTLPHLDRDPVIPASCYIDPTARINGAVTMGDQCSVWFNVAIRGDVNAISIGARTNIQDLCVLHTSYQTHPLELGDEVTLGHNVIAHGCKVGNRVMLGMQSVIMDGVTIEDDVIIGAGSLVTEGKHIPAGVLAFGRPARVIRPLTSKERQFLRDRAQHYVATAACYRDQGRFFGWSDNPYHNR